MFSQERVNYAFSENFNLKLKNKILKYCITLIQLGTADTVVVTKPYASTFASELLNTKIATTHFLIMPLNP